MTDVDPIDIAHRRAHAVASARRAMEVLAEQGVTALVTGLLARDGSGRYSGIDFLITACPRPLKYAIEGIIEDVMGGIPFDVIYLEELPAGKFDRLTKDAVGASGLG